jgi:hypothetical protein
MPRTWRTRLDFRRLSTPPDEPPTGTERFYVNASGALRQLDDEGNDTAAGGAAEGGPSEISDISGLQAALDAATRAGYVH